MIIGCKWVSAMALIGTIFAGSAQSQTLLSDPKFWRPMSIIDLRLVGPQQAPHATIWADLIAKNNALARGPVSQKPAPVSLGNATATVASVTVRSPDVTVILGVLYAPRLCEPLPSGGGTFRCPMRLARFEHGRSTIREGTACFAAGKQGEANPVAFASYDPGARMIRLGVLSVVSRKWWKFEGGVISG